VISVIIVIGNTYYDILNTINNCGITLFSLDHYSMPYPDFVIVFGGVNSLLGYPPWQLKTTEIL